MRIKRSRFNLSHENKLTCDMGQLVPVLCELALPGDKWKCRIDAVMRISPLLAPLMHNVKLFFHTFSVPLRLLMNEKEWENFITGGVNGDDTSVLPTITFANGIETGTLADYLGFPTNTSGNNLSGITVSALPFRAYALIYNEWYRNQNLQDEIGFSTEMGVDTTTNTSLMNRNWRKDYFTGNLPFQQRGQNVILPLGTQAPVYGTSAMRLTAQNSSGQFSGDLEVGLTGSDDILRIRSIPNSYDRVGVRLASKSDAEQSGQGSGVVADLSANSAGSNISDFYIANAIYNFMTRQARGGARYVETLLSQFGVRSSDARLQRPEYIGGGASQLVVTPVLQTSSTDTVSPQGNMAGQAFSAQRSKQFSYFFEEHCIVMTLMSVMPATSYQQGIRRPWLYRTRYDFPWPVFSHMPEQTTYLGELFATGNNSNNYQAFGFNPIYEEMRKIPDSVHGEFRTTLNYWHMGRIFENAPALNSDFITANPTKRINAVTSEHNCWVDIGFNIKAKRPIAKRGTPSLRTTI